MTRAHHVTHSYTAERIEKIRKLLAALQARPLARDEISAVLEVGPSGVRKYLDDLRGMFTVDAVMGEDFVRLTTGDEKTRAFIAALEALAPARAPKRAARPVDPSRHIHIMRDDVHFPIRPHRAPIVRDALVAALFGQRLAEARA